MLVPLHPTDPGSVPVIALKTDVRRHSWSVKLNESTRYFTTHYLTFFVSTFNFFVQIISVLSVAIYSVIINKAHNLIKQAISEVQEEEGYDTKHNEEG